MPQRLKQGTLYMVLELGGSMIASFLSQVLASRVLGPEIYGLFGLVVANSPVVAGFVDPGLSAAMATLVAEKEPKKDKNQLRSVVNAGILIEALIIAVIIAITIAVNKTVAKYFFSSTTSLTLIFLVYVAVQGFYGVFVGIMQGFRELRDLSIVRFFQQFIFLLMILLLVRNTVSGLMPALYFQLLSMLLALVISVVLSKKYIDRVATSSILGKEKSPFRLLRPSKDIIKEVVAITAPISLAAVATSLIMSSGPAILNYLTNNNPGAQLGILVVLLTLTRTFDRIIKTIIRSAFPYLVRWNTIGSKQKTKQYTYLMTLFIVLGYLLLFVGVLLFGKPAVLMIYGADYASVAKFLPIAILAYSMTSLQDIFRTALYSMKASALFLVNNVIGLVVFGLCITLGQAMFDSGNFILQILLSIAIANFIILVGSFLMFQVKFNQSTVIILEADSTVQSHEI